jgi:hypothetical protein
VHYYLRILMSNNATIWTGPVYVTYDPSAITAVAPRDPESIALAVGPNPSFGRMNAAFALARAARNVDFAIFDPSGRRVKTLIAGPLAAGPQSLTWGGTDDAGRHVPSGIYFVRLMVDDRSATKKIMMVR